MERTKDGHNNQTHSRAIAENAEQRQEESGEALSFVDNRSETTAQRRLAGDIRNAPRHAATNRMADVMHSAPLQRKQNGAGMPDNLKSGLENLSGISMDHVKVHYNSPKPAQLNAHAFTQGSDIHIAGGQEKHLAHEGWHVVQQAQGRVQPTMQMAGTQINDEVGLETEADVMGAKALQMAGSANSTTSAPAGLLMNHTRLNLSHEQNRTTSLMPVQRAGEVLGSAYYWLKSIIWDLPMHVWRLIKHLTVGLGVSLVKVVYHFGLALYEGFHNGNWKAFTKNMAKALLGDPLFWALKLLSKVLDLVAFGEGMDLIMTIVKSNTRKMNAAEITACRTVFGNKINYDQVRVDENSLLNTHVFRFWIAFTTWHTVNWPNGSSFATDPGTFIHEMTHIWQMERRGTQYIAEAPYAGGLNGAGYVYAVDRDPGNIANGIALQNARAAGSTIWSYNLEQQAEICRHYYERNTAGLPVNNWQPYIDDIQGRTTMPVLTWLQEPAFLP